MADISKITIPNGSGTNTYDLKDSEAREGLLSTVKYTEQSLTSEQQAQARENIGAAASDDIPTDSVKYTAQTLTDAQKTQARTNIGVVQPDWRQSSSSNADYIKNKPPILAVYPGTSGSYTGGTGMNNMNEATKQNSVAYGYGVSAKGDYSSAFGYFLQALHDYEIAYGKFNQSNADTAFSIGDGADTQNRHNLMELKTDGTLLLNGNAVKTEGGDDDNKLRLGQICGITDAQSSTETKSVYQGFKNLLASGSTTSIVFSSSDMTGNVSRSGQYKVQRFGDFIGCTKAESTVEIAPLAGRTAGKTKTGAWILVESCYYMFYGCSGVTSLDLSMFDTSEVKDMTQMFYNCTALTTLDISSFDMSNVVRYTDMFGSHTHSGIITLKCPKINPHDDIPLPRTLYSQDGTAYTNLPVTTGMSIELRQSWT